MAGFGDVVRLARALNRHPPKAIADDLGIDRSHYGRLENGSRQPSAETLRILAERDGLSLNTVLLAFMLLDDNISAIPDETDDFGNLVVRWLHRSIGEYSRANETDAEARHLLSSAQKMTFLLRALSGGDGDGFVPNQDQVLEKRRTA